MFDLQVPFREGSWPTSGVLWAMGGGHEGREFIQGDERVPFGAWMILDLRGGAGRSIILTRAMVIARGLDFFTHTCTLTAHPHIRAQQGVRTAAKAFTISGGLAISIISTSVVWDAFWLF